MKNVLRKVQIASLAVLVGFGANTIMNGTIFQPSANNQYVLSRYSPKHNLINSWRRWQSQYTITFPWSVQESEYTITDPWQSDQSQYTITDPSQSDQSGYTIIPTQSQQTQSTKTTTSLPENTQGSSNWAGYVVAPTSGSGYTSVSGSWTVPNITASKRNAVAAQWIGLGGVNSSDLLQMGTMEDMESGQPMAEVFWEQLPDVAQNVMSVPIGSTVNVNISQSPSSSSTWNLTFTANTPDGQTQTKTISTTLDSSYAQGIGTSAEWISEDPSDSNGKLVPLANMGTVNYKSAMVDGQPLNASGNNVEPVALESSNGNILIAPSALGTDGESFTTTPEATKSTSRKGLKKFRKPVQRSYIIRFRWSER